MVDDPDAPRALHTLVGEKIGSIRGVTFQAAGSPSSLPPRAPDALEIETKSGKVVHLADGPGGSLQVGRGSVPGTPEAGTRHARDLTERLPFAFDGRPEVRAVHPIVISGTLTGCRFELSTGARFSYSVTARGPRLDGNPGEPTEAEPRPTVRVEPATHADFDAILRVNEAAVPHVNSIDYATLESLAAQACAFSVARTGPELAGFLLVLPDGARYESPNYGYFARSYPSFAYVDRIVVAQPFRGAGVGRALYRALIEQGVGKPLLTCEVNVRPPNPGSMAFHRAFGFRVVAEQDTEGGRKRVALMVRELS